MKRTTEVLHDCPVTFAELRAMSHLDATEVRYCTRLVAEGADLYEAVALTEMLEHDDLESEAGYSAGLLLRGGLAPFDAANIARDNSYAPRRRRGE